MIRSVTTIDPEWTDDDVAAALAWADDQADRCPGCGHHRSETLDPERVNAYEAEPVACHACQSRDRTVKAYRQKKGDEDGLYWVVRERRALDG